MPRSRCLPSLPLVAGGLLCAAGVAGIAGFGSAEPWVARAFNAALPASAGVWHHPAERHAAGFPMPRVGDEQYWLSRADGLTPTSLAGPLTVGDRIEIRAPGALRAPRVLEVVSLRPIDSVLNGHAAASATRGLSVVTARIVEGDGGRPVEAGLVRFIVEDERQAPAAVPRLNKAL